MLESPEKWSAVMKYAEKALTAEEVAEYERQQEVKETPHRGRKKICGIRRGQRTPSVRTTNNK